MTWGLLGEGEEREALAVQIPVRGDPVALRPPCRALGAALEDFYQGSPLSCLLTHLQNQ